ncbi:BQ2448_4406 [Microbotryum intermedium]|uniref:BQ2448_4406 protein n=1 Tax=Microbotryum intermedium TaxID=269621 RepID=A0A238FJA0_9BASI|nr:BQ2448_4406 [Microbotryum intermedium]
MSDAATQQVIEALNVLYTDPSSEAKETANAWLSNFQKSNEAWATSHLILFAPDAPIEPKLFAAQTFRTKISFDLDQLPGPQLVPLRDSLLSALRSFAVSGPRVILTQICIALADLALQLTSQQWADPTSSMIELLGQDPAMAAALLEFLQVLAEEYASNLKIEVKNDFGRGQANGKGPSKGEQVVGLLSMYVQAPGITPALQNQCYACLGSWLRTGQTTSSSLAGSAILSAAFASLASEECFDTAVDVLVDIIHETQELEDNVQIIQELVPRLTALKPMLSDPATREDEDRMRGYCRILVEAGETYTRLIVEHQDSFAPLVEAIAECAAYDNLDIVSITLRFWYRLSQGLGRSKGVSGSSTPNGASGRGPSTTTSPAILSIFSQLVGTIIRHLHYPDDDASLVGEERDQFRTFRHDIGDTLKDCCSVLGAIACLHQSYEQIMSALTAASLPSTPGLVNGSASMTPAATRPTTPSPVKWQDLEAPLFSMRSMGAQVDVHDNEIMPTIMKLVTSLPAHPKIRYAAILVIGRYTEWVNYHPDHIQQLLPFISSGFEQGEGEVSAAAAQAMKYLCKDCSQHLVPFLPDLHAFVQGIANKIAPEDLLDLSAAIAHIIAAMDSSTAPQALSTFCMPNVEVVHQLTRATSNATKDELRSACDALERLDCLLAIVDRFPEGLPTSCASTVEQGWHVFDAFLARYGSDSMVAEKTSVVIRRGLYFFDELVFSLAIPVLERLTTEFERNPASSYLWITAKMVDAFASRRDTAFDAAVRKAFERQAAKIVEELQSRPPAQIGDVLDDFVHLFLNLVEQTPDVILPSLAFPAAFQAVVLTLTLYSPHIVLAALDAVRSVVGHDALDSPGPSPFALTIKTTISSMAQQLVSLLVDTLVEGDEDVAGNVLTVLRLLSIRFPNELAQNVPSAVGHLPTRIASEEEKKEFLGRFEAAVSSTNPNGVKESFTWLLRRSRMSRERART